MHLVEILLPVADNEGKRFDARKYEKVRQDLSRRFGGITGDVLGACVEIATVLTLIVLSLGS